MRKQEKGITLIALVVTIVVLLILAGVSIAMLGGENGIITQALQAKEQNEIAEEKEKIELAVQSAKSKTNWGEITEDNLKTELGANIGNENYNLEEDGRIYVVKYTESQRSYYIDEDGNVGEVVKIEGLKVGDYVDYKPTTNTEGYTLTSDITGSTSNTHPITQDQQYTTETGTGMTWQILRIYADGSMDLIGSPTSQTVAFKGANGYNNGVEIMNDICETLYSRGTIKARNINNEDIEYWMTDKGKTARNEFASSGGVTYGHTATYITNRYYPNLYLQEKGGKIDSGKSGLIEGIDQEQGNITGLDISEQGIASGYTQANSSLTVTETLAVIPMNDTNFGSGYNILKTSNAYWIASRCAVGGVNQAVFGLEYVNSSEVTGEGLFISTTFEGGGNKSLRPVVYLDSNVQIENCTGENNVGNMHKIIQY